MKLLCNYSHETLAICTCIQIGPFHFFVIGARGVHKIVQIAQTESKPWFSKFIGLDWFEIFEKPTHRFDLRFRGENQRNRIDPNRIVLAVNSAQNSVSSETLSRAPGLACRGRLVWPVTRAWPSLLRAPGLACRARLAWPVGHSLPSHCLHTPSSVVGEKISCREQLCRDRNSPYFGQFCRDIELICRDIIPPYFRQLCHDRKLLA